MPELPEVETTRRGIAPHIIGATIQRLEVRQPLLRWPVPDSVHSLAGCAVAALERRGKYLVLATGSGQLLIHLGMSGSLRLCASDEPPLAHDHLDICFTNGTALRLRDPRRFGAVLFTADAARHSLLSHLGPEPLTEAFSGDYMHRLSRNKTRNVKKFIMDSRVVVGVGNIYANEALFMAAIRPTAQAGKVSRKRYQALAGAIKQVLAAAIAAGGTTLKDFVNGDGNPGYFKQQLQVYGREHQPCRVCAAPLKQVRIDNRATVYCRVCQR